ncbi:cytochrome P450 [Actinomadura physcomitrii]|uniref:cytochrome P450 n=1 Tax=Actinomadura physcomitrii TaxID=2650748 RepID=UPI002E26EC55
MDLRRGSTTPHLAFGGGPHRCLGSHLARIEMSIALRGWHEAIPEYGLAPGATPRPTGRTCTASWNSDCPPSSDSCRAARN